MLGCFSRRHIRASLSSFCSSKYHHLPPSLAQVKVTSSPRVLSRLVLNILAAYSTFVLISKHFFTTLKAPLQWVRKTCVCLNVFLRKGVSRVRTHFIITYFPRSSFSSNCSVNFPDSIFYAREKFLFGCHVTNHGVCHATGAACKKVF